MATGRAPIGRVAPDGGRDRWDGSERSARPCASHPPPERGRAA